MRSLLAFFALTYAIAWIFFIAGGVTGLGFLFFLGAMVPAVVALLLARASERIALIDRVFKWRVALGWYVFAALYMVTIKLTVAIAHRVIMGVWPRFGDTPWYLMILVTIISTPFQAGEEIGWRGFALPRLIDRFGFAGASILLGIIWACWHLPIFFVPGADKYGQSFIVYLLQVTALSVALAWLYVRTGSLLPVMLMHAAVNNTKDIVPSALPGATNPFTFHAAPVAWMTVALLWLCAGFFLWRAGVSPAADARPARPL